MMLPRIAQRVFDTELMIDERKAVAFLAGFGGRLIEGGVEFPAGIPPIDHVAFQTGRASMGRLSDRLGQLFDAAGRLPFDMVGDVAVIGVEGTLVHKGAFVGQASGQTSYQGLQTQVARAARSEKVKGIVFEIDSFGGEAAGAFETADMIAKLSKAKPTIAILTENALSAGYLMAAATRMISIPKMGAAGSIGVVSLHLDLSQQAQQEGVKVTIVKSGAHKTDGNAFEPLADDVRARMQARADAQRDMFAAAVGRYRGQRLTKAKAMATEAQWYSGDDAVALGLADTVARGSDAFDAFVKAINRA